MPWDMKKSGSGYKVVTQGTGHAHSNKPMTKQNALKQMRLLYMLKQKGKIK